MEECKSAVRVVIVTAAWRQFCVFEDIISDFAKNSDIAISQ
jgi:hypothetical protein